MILQNFDSFIKELRLNAYVNKAVQNNNFEEMFMEVMKGEPTKLEWPNN